MPRRMTALVPGSFYHLYNLGHNGGEIFFEPQNYHFFLRQFRKYVCDQHTSLIAYVLMPNHYHLMLEVRSDAFSHAMQNFSISYVKAINKRYKQRGSLYQGTFRAKLIEQNSYLLHLSRYIHLNPVTAGLVDRPEEWEYSSYRDYIGLHHGSLLQPEIILSQFLVAGISKYQLYRQFVEEQHNESILNNLLFD